MKNLHERAVEAASRFVERKGFDGIDMIVVNAGRALLRHHINKLGSLAESFA